MADATQGGINVNGGTTTGTTSNTTSSTGSLPADISANYTGLLNQATQVAGNPYPLYTGERVAPLNATQNAAFQGIAGLQGQYNPLMNQANLLAQQGSQAITPTLGTFGAQQLQQYGNPYTQSVIDNTNQQIQRQAAIGNQGIAGNAAEAGAYGGDRATVAQTENNRNALNAIALNTANLNSQNFTQAQQQFNTEQNRNLAAQEADSTNALRGSALDTANASAGQQLGLNGLSALLGSGNQMQTQQQLGDTTAYNEFQNQANYPEKQLSWESGIQSAFPSGLYSNKTTTSTGANSTTVNPNQNGIAQDLGYLTSGVGLLGATGAFGTSANNNTGWLSGLGSNVGNGIGSIYNSLFGSGSSALDSAGSLIGDGSNVSSFFAEGGLIGYANGGLTGYAAGGDASDDSSTDPMTLVTPGGWPYHESTDAHLRGQRATADTAATGQSILDAASSARDWLLRPQDQNGSVGGYLADKIGRAASLLQPDVPQYADAGAAAPSPQGAATMGLDGTPIVAPAAPAGSASGSIVPTAAAATMGLDGTPIAPPAAAGLSAGHAPGLTPGVVDEQGTPVGLDGQPAPAAAAAPPAPAAAPPPPAAPNGDPQADVQTDPTAPVPQPKPPVPQVTVPAPVAAAGIAAIKQAAQSQQGQGIAGSSTPPVQQAQQGQQTQQVQQPQGQGIAAGQHPGAWGSRDPIWQTILSTGAALMNNHSKSFGGALGQALEAGQGTYQQQQQIQAANALKQAQMQNTAAYQQARVQATNDGNKVRAQTALASQQNQMAETMARLQQNAATMADNRSSREAIAAASRDNQLLIANLVAGGKPSADERQQKIDDAKSAAQNRIAESIDHDLGTQAAASGTPVDPEARAVRLVTSVPGSDAALAISRGFDTPRQVPLKVDGKTPDTARMIPGQTYPTGKDGSGRARWDGSKLVPVQ